MDIKRPASMMNKERMRLLTAQLQQTYAKHKTMSQQNIKKPEPPRLSRASSNITLKKSRRLELFMPKSPTPTMQKEDTYKLSEIAPVDSCERLNTGTNLDGQGSETGQYYVKSLSKGRILKSQTLRRSDDPTSTFTGSVLQNEPRSTPQPTPVKEMSHHFHKESFETLLSFFKKSSSKNPIQLFPETGKVDGPSIVVPNQAFSGTPDNKTLNKKMAESTQRLKTEPPKEPENKEAQVSSSYIERVISDLFTATGTSFSWGIMDSEIGKNMTKRKGEFWDEVLLQHEPALVEILIIDIMNLVIKRHVEMKTATGERIIETFEEHVREEKFSENKAFHLLVFFRNHGKAEKTLILSNYCFYFARNSNFQEELKTEKDVIIFYFLMLGLCQLRMSLENEPLKKIKISSLKEKALNIIKGTESPSKYVLEWLKLRFNNYAIVQKTYFNINNSGAIFSTYLFNIRSYVKSRFPKLFILNGENLPSKSSLLLKKPTTSHRSVISNIEALAMTNISELRNQNLLFSKRWPNEQPIDMSTKRQSLIVNQKPKPPNSPQGRAKIKLDILNVNTEVKSPKTRNFTPKLELISAKGDKAPSILKKSNSKGDLIIEKTSSRGDNVSLRLEKNPEKVLNTPSKSRAQTKPNICLEISPEPLTPWCESPTSERFDSPRGI